MELAIYMPTGKVAKLQLEETIKSMYLSGDLDPLRVEVGIKGIEDAIKAIRKDPQVRDAVLNALSLYNEKTIDLAGAQITKKNTPAKYEFEACGDPVWERLDAKMKAIANQKKERENFLKALTKMEVVVDQETGEACDIIPPPKTQGETLAITFK